MAGRSKATEPAGPGQRAGLTGEPAEVTEEPAEVIGWAAAIDVAKGSGTVCTRVPHEASSHRRIQRVWQVTARYADVVALMDELVSAGIQRLVIESTSDYWRIWYYLAEAAGLQVWLVNARDAKHLPGRPKTDKWVWPAATLDGMKCSLRPAGRGRRIQNGALRVRDKFGAGPAGPWIVATCTNPSFG